MKRSVGVRIGLILLALTIWMISLNSAFAFVNLTWYVRATARVNVRSGPGVSYSDFGTLEKNEQVPYLNESAQDKGGQTWYKIRYYSFGDAWVSSAYSRVVTDQAGMSGVASINSQTVGSYVEATNGDSNLRTGPGLGYDDIGTVKDGECARYLNMTSVDERGVRWYKVFYNGEEGWLSSRYTTLREGVVLDYTNMMYYARATARVNLRTGPGMDYPDIGTLDKEEQVYYLFETQTDDSGLAWYKVQYYSQGVAWVSSAYCEIVMDYPNMMGIANLVTDITGTYVEATGGKSNLRTGPGLDYDDIDTIKKGERAYYMGSYSRDERGVLWYRVNFDGQTGWLSSRYTTLY